MANDAQLKILEQGVEVWNKWIRNLQGETVDLSGADLSHLTLRGINFLGANIKGANFTQSELIGARLNKSDLSDAILKNADLSKCNLNGVNLTHADLTEARLSQADLSGAHLRKAVLTRANLTQSTLYRAILHNTFLEEANLSQTRSQKADLKRANLNNAFLFQADFSDADLTETNLTRSILSRARLNGANLTRADLTEADLKEASLVNTKFTNANLSGCSIFGISAWKLNTEGAIQSNLLISDKDEPEITVDNLEVAQFVYLLLHNQKLRDIIDTIGKKAVLILGRFTAERKAVLDAIRDELRKRSYIPIMFDFEKPASRDYTETISTLAHLSRFVIANITGAKAVPMELKTIVPNLPSVAVQPIILDSEFEFSMFDHIRNFKSVLPVYRYESQEALLAVLSEKVVQPAERLVNELRTGGHL
jgi:uncharacterized protein YjbI with pentapeptide repeats